MHCVTGRDEDGKGMLHAHGLLLTVLLCVSDENVQEMAEELVQLGLISEVGL